jgi:drug/metabolite transporter (DMT)-like permease
MNLGVARISAGESSILTYTQPLIVALLAWAFLAERPSARKLSGLALGFVGVVAVVADKVRPGAAPEWLGYGFALGGGFFWAVGTLFFRSWQRRLDILWTTALQALYGAVPLALLALAVEHPSLDLGPELGWTLAFTGLGSAGLAYLIWFYLLRHRDVAEVNSYVFLVPLFAVLFGAAVLDERLGPVSLLGAALILGGIYVVGTRRGDVGPPFLKAKSPERGRRMRGG